MSSYVTRKGEAESLVEYHYGGPDYNYFLKRGYENYYYGDTNT